MTPDCVCAPIKPAEANASEPVLALVDTAVPGTAGASVLLLLVVGPSGRDFLAIINLEGRRTILASTARFCSTKNRTVSEDRGKEARVWDVL